MRFRLVPAIICLSLAVLGMALGLWQMSRAQGKRDVQQLQLARQGQAALTVLPENALELVKQEWRRVRLKGEFVSEWPVYLDNRQQQGVQGIWVLMPFKLAHSGRPILVARGWLPRNKQQRNAIAPYATPAGEVVVEGLLRTHPARLLQLGPDAPLRPGVLRQNLSLSELTEASGLPLLPMLLEQTVAATPQDQLGREWPQPSSGIDKHLGYAFQWFALTGVALIFLFITGLRRATK
jgi:surfeit locus 1 family protein